MLTQRDLSRRLGISPALVTKYKRLGMPLDEAGARAWREANVGAYHHTTPAPATPSTPPTPAPAGQVFSLTHERAALANAQRQAIELKTRVMNGEYASITLLSQVLASASAAVAERLDALPVHIKRRVPLLPASVLQQVTTVINEARNEWVRQTAELVAAQLAAGDFEADDDDEAGDAEAGPA